MADHILITGGSSGIGAAVARLASQRGIPVAITFRSHPNEAAALVAELRAAGGEAHAFSADVAREADVVRAFERADAAFPGRSLAGLVNSAGISAPHGSVTSFTGDALAPLFAVNVIGTIVACREAIKRFDARPKPGGAIVNVSSMAATIGGRAGAAAYAASKAAVDTFTVGLAKEVAARGIRANVVRPGLTKTPMVSATIAHPEVLATVRATIPINRIASAEEVAYPILWLLSEEASFVTGARLDVSGGGFVVPGRLGGSGSDASALAAGP